MGTARDLTARLRTEVRDRIGDDIVARRLPGVAQRARAAQFPLRAAPTPAGIEPPEQELRTGSYYDTDWARTFPARFARVSLVEGVMRPTMAVIAKPRRRGIDRLADLRDDGGPAIFCANHHSHIDTPLILSSLPEPWRHQIFVGAAADYFFKTRASGAAAALVLNAIPIERSTVTRRSARQAAELIEDGWSMLIFPEGGRSPDGWGQEFRGGAAYLARKTGRPIVPIHVAGTGRILRKGTKRLTPSPTAVNFGAPLWPSEGEDTRKLAARLQDAVSGLADEQLTDWYSARVRAHAGAALDLTGPDAPSWRRQWALGERGPKRRRRATWPDR